jgi:hypothetical protein
MLFFISRKGNHLIFMKKIFTVCLMLLGFTAFAQKPGVVLSNDEGWQKIGEITASFKMQNESIIVLGADRFNEIKLKVTEAPIQIERLQVVYESGEVEDYDILNQLEEGAETRSILIDGDEDINKVVFTYKTLRNADDDKAHVELYGFKGRRENTSSYKRDMDGASNKTIDDDIVSESEQIENEIDSAAENIDNDVQQSAENPEPKPKDAVDKVGDKISEMAANAAAEVNDQMFTGKMGPDGQNVYIDKHDKYYYVNKEGHKVYISKSELKDKPKN